MSEMVTVTVTLAGVIVTLAGVIVWSVRFLANRLVGAFDGLKAELHANTTALHSMEAEQKTTNALVVGLAKAQQ